MSEEDAKRIQFIGNFSPLHRLPLRVVSELPKDIRKVAWGDCHETFEEPRSPHPSGVGACHGIQKGRGITCVTSKRKRQSR